MSTMFSTLLSLGQITRGDAVVVSMKAKSGESISPGDFVTIAETSDGTDPKQVEVKKGTAATDCIYGVATIGIQGDIIPIVTSGHVIAAVSSTIYSSAAVGKCLCKTPGTHCCLLLIKKLSALKADGSKDEAAYEIKL